MDRRRGATRSPGHTGYVRSHETTGRPPRSPVRRTAGSPLLFAGCLSVESNLTINDDGTVDVQLSTVIDTEQLGRIGGLLGEDTNVLEGLGGDELLSRSPTARTRAGTSPEA